MSTEMLAKVAQLRGARPRKPLADTVRIKATWGAAQAAGGLFALGGFYLATNIAAALMLGGVSLVAVATGKEAGWL